MPDNVHSSDRPAQLDLPDGFLTIPASKLDAEQYSADDIDGVTESVFGSGNMAYASLQASQTDAAAALNDALFLELGAVADPERILFSGGKKNVENTNADAPDITEFANEKIPTDTDRALDSGDVAGTENIQVEGNFSHAAVGTIGASAFSSDGGSFSSVSSGGISNFDSATERNTISTTVNITNNINVDDTVQNILNTVNETVNNITNLGDEILENIIEGDVEEVVNIVTDQVDELTQIIGTEINNITETVNNILQDSGITEITNQVTGVTNGITEVITGTVNDITGGILEDGGIAVDLDTGILESLEDVTGLDVPVLPDTGMNVGVGLLDGEDVSDGNDLSVAGIDMSDIALDPVENIVGDVDMEAELPTDINALTGIIEDLMESVDDTTLSDAEGIWGTLGEEGAEGSLDIAAGGAGLEEGFDFEVDDLGDDLNIDDAIDMLAMDDGTLADAPGDDGWTESTIDAGGLFDDILNGIAHEADALPDPGGTVAEGLGVLNTEPNLDVGGLGGLFG